MLRAHRCRRYAARLKELIRCTPVDPLLLTEGEVTDLACLHADSTRPTAGECLLHDDRSPVLAYRHKYNGYLHLQDLPDGSDHIL